LEWIGSDPDILPSVDCIHIVTTTNSSELPVLLNELSLLNMRSRVSYSAYPADMQGKAAGCFRSHVAEWNRALARGCEMTLMLESDAVFYGPVLNQSMALAEKFLSSRHPFDVLLLGWESNLITGGHLPQQNLSKVTDVGLECVYKVNFWFETHAYVMPRATMERLKDITYEGVPIDNVLSEVYAPNSTFFLAPKVAFQSLHRSSAVKQDPNAVQTGGVAEIFNETPLTWYAFEEPAVFERSHIIVPPKCKPPNSALQYPRPILEPPPQVVPQQLRTDDLESGQI
ncbi:MAG: hypothetical protein SGPRY_011877, partial [Prymnesium sp.]